MAMILAMIRLIALLWLGLASSAYAQLASVSPSTLNVEMWRFSASGPYGPMKDGGGGTITLSGTGTWSSSQGCFGGVLQTKTSGTLPDTIRVRYTGYFGGGPPTWACLLTFTGGSGGSGTSNVVINFVDAAHPLSLTDGLGTLISALGFCATPTPDINIGTSYRRPPLCTLQQSTIRPGGTFVAPAMGGSYIDETFGAKVVNQGAGYTRSYSTGNQISYDGNWIVLWRLSDQKAVIHRIDAADSSEDVVIGGTGELCSIGSSGNIQLGTTAGSAFRGMCMARNGSAQTDIRRFSWTPGSTTPTDLGLFHRHPVAMDAGLWGTGQCAMDGWCSHMDNNNQICVNNWISGDSTDVCVTYPHTIRNAHIAPYPSRSDGKHYIFASSDNPNNLTYSYSFDSRTKTITLTGDHVGRIETPDTSNTNAYWGNRPGGASCVEGVDCAVGGHHNSVFFAGEPWDCGTGRGMPNTTVNFTGQANCVAGFAWTRTSGMTLWPSGPVFPGISPTSDYFTPARGPAMLYTGSFGQGLIPAWRISSCTASAGIVTCTLASGGNLDGSGWANGTTPLYIDGFLTDTAFNGRFTLGTRSSTTFTYSCGGCSGTTASNQASVTFDQSVFVTKPSLAGGGAIDVCRYEVGHCRTIANPISVSYGDGAGSFGAATGNWQGFNVGSVGYQALTFPVLSQNAGRACWVTDLGYLEKLHVACAQTGRPDLGLPPFDLDESTTPNCFDRHGRCVTATNVLSDRVTVTIKPTSPSFSCEFTISTSSGFVTEIGTTTLAGPGSDRSATTSGLTSNTQYFLRARCGPVGKIWDVGVTAFRTK